MRVLKKVIGYSVLFLVVVVAASFTYSVFKPKKYTIVGRRY